MNDKQYYKCNTFISSDYISNSKCCDYQVRFSLQGMPDGGRCPHADCRVMSPVDYSERYSRIRVSLIKEDIMGKEKNKQKPNEKKKPQHSLKEKRQAKKEKAEGKSPSI